MTHLPRLLLPALALGGCWGGPSRPEPTNAQAPTLALSKAVPFAELEVPADSRDGEAPPERIPLGPWKLAGVDDGLATWQAPLPIRTRSLFFGSPSPGMEVERADGTVLQHERAAGAGDAHWTFGPEHVRVTVPEASGAPDGWFFRYPRATAREAELNHGFSGVADPAVFARATVQAGEESRTGLLLPAPGVAAWDVDVPPSAELSFAPALIRPETLDGPASDGATLVVEVEADGSTTEVWRQRVHDDAFDAVRVDLSRWSGRSVRLRFRSEPGASSRFDYAFFADPVLGPRKADPRRVVVVYVDTLRPDHLGTYGYERDTSPALDAFAEGAAVFENARSVAPWTLPTALSLLTGRHPELYDAGPTLAGQLSEQGWATAMLAGNVYLSSNFGLNRDWGLHRVENWPPADEQVDRALAWLEENDGRDAMLLLHFMDPHLPYVEPRRYRRMFAGDAPDSLGERFHRPQVLRANLDDEAKQYVRDRYDNNIRFVDDELSRLFATLDDDDVVVFLSDHGEEFWEHGRFEHGHTLYDEVLRVPLVVRAPGVEPGRVEAPVSIVDVAPTLLDALGLSPTGPVDGTSLLPVVRGDDGAETALRERSLAIGRPLYGDARWGVLHGDEKYTTTRGREALFDLSSDPGEHEDLIGPGDTRDGAPYRARLAAALDREVHTALRFVSGVARARPTDDLVLTLPVPGGVRAAWVADDPTNASSAEVTVRGDEVEIRWHAGFRGSREVYVVPESLVAPAEPADDPTPEAPADLIGQLVSGDHAAPLSIPGERVAAFSTGGASLANARVDGRKVTVTWGIAPAPDADIEAIHGDDDELREMLQQMGYTVGD